MIKLAYLAAAPLLALPLFVRSSVQSDEREAVERAVTDYVEALYEVKPELIERSVHPALQKLGCWRPDGADKYGTPGVMTFEQLHSLAGHWNKDGRELTYDIQLLDVLDITASAKLSADWGVDYMHLIKRDGQWKIVQILWQSHPPKE